MNPDTDFVVRSWRTTPAGHARATVVDMHGRIAHVTITKHASAHGDVEQLIRDRLAHLPTFVRYRQ
ncbi:MAG TPA: hypothetical protein VFO15_18010 [Xanthobacteraceae bacterium]|nr:hypothetical protein [Xanthobacteraceae bacterium]